MILFDNTIFKITFQYQLSYLIVPLAIILYLFVESYSSYLWYHMGCCGLIGTVDTINYYRLGNTGVVFTISSVICHLLLLLVLMQFKKYGKINPISLFLLFIVNVTIFYLPFWPYSFSRKVVLFSYNLIYAILSIVSLYY